MTNEELKARYGASSEGHFAVTDTIGVPHPYTIGAKHVAHASDHHGGMLNEYAIQQGEKIGITCAHRGCKLSYADHKQALIVECTAPLQVPDLDQPEPGVMKASPELHAYLMKCKPLCEADKYEGFAFLDRTKARA